MNKTIYTLSELLSDGFVIEQTTIESIPCAVLKKGEDILIAEAIRPGVKPFENVQFAIVNNMIVSMYI